VRTPEQFARQGIQAFVRFWEYDAGSIRLGGHELREYRIPSAARCGTYQTLT
jgi:hypothetical protein